MCVPVKLLHSTVSKAAHDLQLFLTPAQASGVAVSVALYYLLLAAAASAFVQQLTMLPFWNGSFTTYTFRTCGHLILSSLVFSSCWLSVAKFHSSMVDNGTWREDGCDYETTSTLGVEFVLHLSSVLLYCCVSSSSWLPSRQRAELLHHDHNE
jgi:hypothetical protein